MSLHRDDRQTEAGAWVARTFGADTMHQLDERAARVFEEAAELAQAMGMTVSTAFKIVGYVFAKPVGEIKQEIGGVGLTLLAAAEAVGISADDAERDELSRVLAKSPLYFQRRQDTKRRLGLTPGIRSGDAA